MRFNLMLFKEIPARQVFDFSFVNTHKAGEGINRTARN